MTRPRLFDVLPALAETLRPVSLGAWPTPVERVVGFADVPHLWIKRDDLAARPYGGSKVRNLEWILGEARAADELLTSAAWGSHLVLALAVHGAAQGHRVSAVLFPQPRSDEVRETVRRVLGAGASLDVCRSYFGVPAAVMRRWWAARRDGRGPYWVAPGGASPVGCLGYVQAALEIRDQVEAGALAPPDYVYCAAGSCGTLVGLSEGLALAGLEARVVAVRVVPRLVTSAPRRGGLHRGLRRLMSRRGGAELGPPAAEVLRHDQAGRGYGHATPEGEAARGEFRECHGLDLDDTYTGKALAGMRSFVRAHDLGARNHLFINTFDAGHHVPLVDLPERIARVLGP